MHWVKVAKISRKIQFYSVWAALLVPAVGYLMGFYWKDILRVYAGLLILAVASDVSRRLALSKLWGKP